MGEVVPSAGFEASTGRDGAVVVRVSGEIDMAAAPVFRERLTAVIEADGDDVVVDLADVSFMTQLVSLSYVRAHQSLESTSRKLLIARPSPPVTRVLEVTGLDRLFGDAGRISAENLDPHLLAGVGRCPSPPVGKS